MMPISSTAMIRPLSHGLARKALKIWRCKTNAIRPHRIRNTSIRMRKMRGDESFARSFPIGPVQRAESPPNNGIARVTGERMFVTLDYRPQHVFGGLCQHLGPHFATCASFCGGLMALRCNGLLAWLLAGLLACRLEQAQQLAVHGVVAGDDLALGQDGVFAV